MSKRGRMILVLLALSICTGLGFYTGRESAPKLTVKLDNSKVTVTESLTPVAGKREGHVRSTDQLIVFIDEANYDAIDASGQTSVRHRQPGEIVWHSKGEVAPVLINKGKAYRNLIIALK